MASLRLPSTLKAAQLKHTAFLLGLPSAGTKSELENLILRHVETPTPLSKPTTIVSVDMGIKNLSICTLETMEPIASKTRTGSEKSKLRIADWKKLDVLSKLSSQSTTPTELDSVSASAKSSLSPTAFTPSILSRAAVQITNSLLTYKPDHILIERQRFRSGGAAAVQEWTLRVNMLESMLWACLESLRASGNGVSPNVHEVSPARVAKFWCLGPEGGGTLLEEGILEQDWKVAEKGSRAGRERKIEKKDKIAVVRSWLSGAAKGPGDSTVSLNLSDEATRVAESFLAETNGRKKRSESSLGKLDDLADCLLQGAAWIRWEENRQRVLRILQSQAT